MDILVMKPSSNLFRINIIIILLMPNVNSIDDTRADNQQFLLPVLLSTPFLFFESCSEFVFLATPKCLRRL